MHRALQEVPRECPLVTSRVLNQLLAVGGFHQANVLTSLEFLISFLSFHFIFPFILRPFSQFVTWDEWLITVSCETMKPLLSVPFKPKCRSEFSNHASAPLTPLHLTDTMSLSLVQLNPPPKPKVNLTTVFWFPQVTEHKRIDQYNSQLQLRRRGQPWVVRTQSDSKCFGYHLYFHHLSVGKSTVTLKKTK